MEWWKRRGVMDDESRVEWVSGEEQGSDGHAKLLGSRDGEFPGYLQN